MESITWIDITVKLSQLQPWEGNPKTSTAKNVKQLQDSRDELGQFQTVAIGPPNGSGLCPVYDGHQRLSSWLIKYGPSSEIAARQSSRSLTDEERRKIAWYSRQIGAWDWDKLANWPADELMEWGADTDLLTDWRRDVAALDAFIDSQQEEEESKDAEPQTNRAEELRQEWGVELGQMWRLPSRVEGQEHRLICGDCTDEWVVSRVMGDEKANIAWFDPPFGIDLQPQRQKTKVIENDENKKARQLWERFLPLIKQYMSSDTNLFLCQGWSEFDWALPLVRQYFTIKSKVVWNKNVWGIGYYTRPKHEDILYCWNGNPPTIAEPVADVWDVARENSPNHAAEKPPGLSGIAIRHFSKPEGIVADWFCGVGGSIIAAENLSRQCRAVEIAPAYVAVALQRYYDAFGIRAELVT
jgi:16S rRNA G966 N2-methylase RsmD